MIGTVQSPTNTISTRSFFSVSDWLMPRQEETVIPLDVVPKLTDGNFGNIITNISAELLHNRAFIVSICDLDDSKGTLRQINLKHCKKDIPSIQQLSPIQSDEMEIHLPLPVFDITPGQLWKFHIPKPLHHEIVGLDLIPNGLQDYEVWEDSIGSTWIDSLGRNIQQMKYRIRNRDFHIDDDLKSYNKTFGIPIGIENISSGLLFKDRVTEVIAKIRNTVGAYTMHNSIQDIYKKFPDFFKTYEALNHIGHCMHISIYLADQLRSVGVPAFVVVYIKRNPKAPDKFKDGYFHTTVLYVDEQGKSNLIDLENVYPKGFNIDTKRLKTLHKQVLDLLGKLDSNIDTFNTLRNLVKSQKIIYTRDNK